MGITKSATRWVGRHKQAVLEREDWLEEGFSRTGHSNHLIQYFH